MRLFNLLRLQLGLGTHVNEASLANTHLDNNEAKEARAKYGIVYPVKDNFNVTYDILSLDVLCDLANLKEDELHALLMPVPAASEQVSNLTEPKKIWEQTFQEMLSANNLVLYRRAPINPGEQLDLERDNLFWSLHPHHITGHGNSKGGEDLTALIPRSSLGEYIESSCSYGSAIKLRKNPHSIKIFSSEIKQDHLPFLKNVCPDPYLSFFNDDVRLFDVGGRLDKNDYTQFAEKRVFFLEEFLAHSVARYMRTIELHLKAGNELSPKVAHDYNRIKDKLKEHNIPMVQSPPTVGSCPRIEGYRRTRFDL